MMRAVRNHANKGSVMRRFVIALGLIGLVSNAFADEFELPTLRGADLLSQRDGIEIAERIAEGTARRRARVTRVDKSKGSP